MQVIEPASYQKEARLLPGSRERSEVEVKSLEELKKALNEANARENSRNKIINRTIVISSILIALFILLGPKSPESASKYRKALRIIGMALSIVGFIKGTIGMTSNLEVIEPESQKLAESNYSFNYNNLSLRDRLRYLSVKATIDVLSKHNIEDKSLLKKRSAMLRFKAPSGVNGVVVNEIINNGKKL